MVSTRTLAGAGVVLVGAGALAFGLLAPPRQQEDGVLPGGPARDFTASTLEDPPVQRTLADYDGSVLLLNVWATWCPPCVEEMPTMQAVHESYADRGLRVVAVSIDDAGTTDLIRSFQAEHGLTFEILHDPTWAIYDTYELNGVPMTFLIDRDGTIRLRRYVADWSSAENRSEIEKLLDD
jgi:peroxiredoxin